MEIPKEYENASDKIRKEKSFSVEVICGKQELCPSCQKYKQGLIQGAKMMIEDEIKFLIELSKFMTAGDEESIRRLEVNTNWCMVLERLKELQDTELKQLNNWLEKEKNESNCRI